MSDHTRAYTKGRPAADIGVSAFRLVFQLPLIAPETGGPPKHAAMTAAGWTHRPDPLALLIPPDPSQPPPDDKTDPEDAKKARAAYEDARAQAYQEHAYFYTFAQKFLYPQTKTPYRCDPAQGLYTKSAYKCLNATIAGRACPFTIDRHTIQFFETGVAMLTVELCWTGGALTLAQTQTVIDYLRRSYVPFWMGEVPARIPSQVALTGDAPQAWTAPTRIETLDAFKKTRAPQLFDHWTALAAPLTIGGGQTDWRDPSDERVPVLSFVAIEKPDGQSERDTLRSIRKGDWIRLVDADQAGTDFAPYNPDFLARLEDGYFYDRFFPHDLMADYVATRHLFGGAHYAAVGTGWFFENVVQHHFRRHYTQLALVARFEYASLLAFSAKVTAAVDMDKHAFDRRIDDLREEFLTFTHRYRFTGVSSQLQAGEMFDKLRQSLDLDTLYSEVGGEIAAASDFAMARTQDREARAATRLTQIATLGLPAGLALAAHPVTLPGLPDMPEIVRLGGFLMLFYGATWFLARMLNERSDKRQQEIVNTVLIAFVLGGAAVILGHYIFGLPPDPAACTGACPNAESG